MISDSRKLKRGLEDISPLFGGPSLSVQTAPQNETSASLCFSQVLCADLPAESARLLARELAFKYSNPSRFSGVLSIASRIPQGGAADGPSALAREAVLDLEKFEAAGRSQEASAAAFSSLPGLVFIEFDSWNAAYFEKIVPALDQWILTASPRMESLAEAYKWIKASVPLNSRLEYFFLMEAAQASGAAGVFERYAEFVFRNLGVRLTGLGGVHFLKGARPHLKMQLDLTQAESVQKAAQHPAKKNLAAFLAA